MTPAELTPELLRTACDSLNPGGQTKLAHLLGMHPTLLRKKLAGKVRITSRDARHVSLVMAQVSQPTKAGKQAVGKPFSSQCGGATEARGGGVENPATLSSLSTAVRTSFPGEKEGL